MIFQALCVSVIILYFLYHYKKIHYKFEAAGVKYLPGVPIFGNTWKSTFLRRHFIYEIDEVYDAFPNEKYVGFAVGMIPVILVRDPELIKTVVVKDFDHFQNKKLDLPTRLDPLLGVNLFQLGDEKWKAMRTQLSPAFSAARLRYMLPALTKVAKNVVNSLKKRSFEEVELTPFMFRYTGDAVTSAAFGFEQDSAGREDSVFYQASTKLYLNLWRRVLIFISLQFPNFGQLINTATGLAVFPKEVHDLFRKAVSEALVYRKAQNLTVPDYMDVLLKISEGKSIDDLAGQLFFSFVASLASGSGILSFSFHELVLHPEIQDRLYQEIRTHEEMGIMTIESISELKYLECVYNEVSRKWSTAVVMDRVCTKPYLLPPPREGGKPYSAQPGDIFFNVVNSIHMDRQYYPDPETFDPERFSNANKHNIKQFTFMPFGKGPRGCIGSRFAILELKVMIYYMVLNFKLVKCKKTADPLQIGPDEGLKVAGGVWVYLEPRK